MKLYTIGFTKKSAERFFGLLRGHGIREVVDIRISASSQLAGFAKGEDLAFFLRELCGIGYRRDPLLAPTEELLKKYRTAQVDWAEYEREFAEIMAKREIRTHIFEQYRGRDGLCLLCSEPTPEHCHRRLVAEIFAEVFPGVEIIHL